ncbi:hypothetical protein Tco_1048447 [Tanacetum coccineum]
MSTPTQWERMGTPTQCDMFVWYILGERLEESEVRKLGSDGDKLNSQVNDKDMRDFNEFINDMRLVEVLMGVIALDRKLSDHYPIVLKDMDLDFGQKSFRIFNIWMEEPYHCRERRGKRGARSGKKNIEQGGKSIWLDTGNDRLKNVKACLRVRSKDRFGGHKEKIDLLKNEAMR